MVKNSTFFFIYNNINKENELYNGEELMEPDNKDAEIAQFLDKIEFTPPDRILKRIFEQIY